MPVSFDILRPDDLVSLHVEAVNLKLDSSRPNRPRLVIENSRQPALLIFQFPPQSIAEQAFFDVDPFPPPPTNPPPPGPQPPGSDPLVTPGQTGERMAADSRLVFTLPATMAEIPYTI